jgi:hypothetical protein
MLCKYKNIFGKPNEGVHSIRFMNLAVVDIISTIIGGFLIGKYFNLNIYLTIFTLFLLGIIAHRLFCVKTQVDKILFSDKN